MSLKRTETCRPALTLHATCRVQKHLAGIQRCPKMPSPPPPPLRPRRPRGARAGAASINSIVCRSIFGHSVCTHCHSQYFGMFAILVYELGHKSGARAERASDATLQDEFYQTTYKPRPPNSTHSQIEYVTSNRLEKPSLIRVTITVGAREHDMARLGEPHHGLTGGKRT